MIGVLERVSRASVSVANETVGAIEHGLLTLVRVETGDGEAQADRLLERLLGYRVFGDANGRMNLDVRAASGGLLLVPQFTLAADTTKGTRPSFTPAAPPQEAALLFAYFVNRAKARHHPVAAGRFGADMQVALVNDGPVTFILHVPPTGM